MSIGGDNKFIGTGGAFGGDSIYDFGARNISNAGDVYNKVMRGGSIAELMPTYMNPYTDEVINRSLVDIGRAGETGLNTLGANAETAGAFGGSRHGLAEADLLTGLNKNAGDLAAGLRHQGFTTAGGLAGQDVAASMDAASRGHQLGMDAYGLGRQSTQDQMQAGTMQQMLTQMIFDKAGGQFDTQAGQPANMLDMVLSALGMSPLNNAKTQTSSYDPGMFDYLKIAAGLGSAALGAN